MHGHIGVNMLWAFTLHLPGGQGVIYRTGGLLTCDRSHSSESVS